MSLAFKLSGAQQRRENPRGDGQTISHAKRQAFARTSAAFGSGPALCPGRRGGPDHSNTNRDGQDTTHPRVWGDMAGS